MTIASDFVLQTNPSSLFEQDRRSTHDTWLLQYTRGERYDKLRKDPRGRGVSRLTESTARIRALHGSGAAGSDAR